MTLITSKGQHITPNSICYFDKCSAQLSSSMTLWLVSDEELTTLNCALTDSTTFQFYTVTGNAIELTTSLQLSDFVPIEQSGKWCYKINLAFTSEEQGQFTDTVTITTNSSVHAFTAICEAEQLDETFAVMLQNFKKWISEEYVSAFYETTNTTETIDWVVYNRKMREYLLNIFDFTAITGSYKHLLSFLSWFGYGDLLTLKEYWRSGDTYKSTSIGASVLTAIDKSLTGYKKTKQMSLVYQINEQTSIDEDGLPVYANVLAETDKILFKLWTLERILERDILSFNTHIVDIVGETQSVIGLELQAILNDVQVDTIDLSSNIVSPITWSYTTKQIAIQRHSVLLKQFALEQVTVDALAFIPGIASATMQETFFDIESTDMSTYQDYDMLTKLYSGDFGLIEMSIDVDTSFYQSCKYRLQDLSDNSYVYTSQLFPINKLDTGRLWCGVKSIGQYRLTLLLIDWYGGVTMIGTNAELNVYRKPVDCFLAKYNHILGRDTTLDMWTTFEDTSNETFRLVVDALSETLDVNTWNPDTNSPMMQIARMYESDFDMLSTWTNLNQLNSIPLHELDGLPLNTWGSTYAVVICDVIGEQTVSQTKTVRIKQSNHSEWIEFDKVWYSSVSEQIWLTELVNELNQYAEANPLSVVNDFTYDVHVYVDAYNGLAIDTKYVLRLRSKQPSYRARLVSVEVQSTDSAKFPDKLFKHDVNCFSRVDAKIQVAKISDATGDFILRFGDTQLVNSNMNVTSVSDISDWLETVLPTSAIVSVVDDTLIIYSKQSITIEHASIGKHYDVVRGLDSSKIERVQLGSDFRLGEPVFAFIDTEKRIDITDCIWTLTNTLTGQIVSIQHAWSFRWILSAKGIYSLKLSGKDINGPFETIKHGAILIP